LEAPGRNVGREINPKPPDNLRKEQSERKTRRSECLQESEAAKRKLIRKKEGLVLYTRESLGKAAGGTGQGDLGKPEILEKEQKNTTGRERKRKR